MRPIDVLLVEDSPTDVLLTREALAGARLAIDLHVVSDGVRALDFLRHRGPYAHAPRPALILLDLDLPREDGREVLREIKEDAELASIPVVVLSISRSEEDVARVYGLHANCYVPKPIELSGLREVVSSIESFWFTTALLPKA